MSIKAKLAAAVQRANEDPKKVNTIKKGYNTYPKMQNRMTETTKTKGTMSSMPTLRPTSVSVSAEKRTAAPLAGQAPMGKTKRRV
jgi:hypothetical protein